MPKLSDYTIEHADLDWAHLLGPWAWLLPRQLTVWLVNRFGDLFVVLEDGSVHMLDVGCGSFERLADSRNHFAQLLDEGSNADEWLMIPLVDELVASGLAPGPRECYTYVQLPVLGGDYVLRNVKIASVEWPYMAFGPIHEKLKDLPDGTQVALEAG